MYTVVIHWLYENKDIPIDRCLVFTGQIDKRFSTLGLYLRFSLYRILVYLRFILDNFHCIWPKDGVSKK